MKCCKVIKKRLKNARFSHVLSEAAIQASRDGIGSDAWIRLAKFFAENEDELRLLVPPTKKLKAGKFDADTLTTLITLSGGITVSTHTTTTASRLCTLPGICPKPSARASGKKKATKAGAKKKR